MIRKDRVVSIAREFGETPNCSTSNAPPKKAPWDRTYDPDYDRKAVS